jgi:DNA-binding CsgD family transcriptional regulator
VLATTTVPWRRARFLPGCVEIMLTCDAVDDARKACLELENIAEGFGTEILGAMASHARGALRLAEGDASSAIEPLRHAFEVWQKVEAPYIAAKIRVLLGRAYLALGDLDGAQLELDAARQVFEQLGAATAIASLSAPAEEPLGQHPLSPREVEVLRHVAQGKTNKEIARTLCLSERTVDRHVSNIFQKIDVSSRAGATAFAYENKLVRHGG